MSKPAALSSKAVRRARRKSDSDIGAKVHAEGLGEPHVKSRAGEDVRAFARRFSSDGAHAREANGQEENELKAGRDSNGVEEGKERKEGEEEGRHIIVGSNKLRDEVLDGPLDKHKLSAKKANAQRNSTAEEEAEEGEEEDHIAVDSGKHMDKEGGLPMGRLPAKKAKAKQNLKALEEKQRKRGVCYLSRVPPHMKPLKLRQLLTPFGEVLRVYLAPEDASIRMRRKKAGGNSGKNFTEGWVEFARKKVAKRVAEMLNGEPIGGKRRSAYHFDLWNITYLSKFKWDNLTEEIAYRNAVREQKLAAEISAATKERDFYLSRVDQSRAIAAMTERKKKRVKASADGSEENANSNAKSSSGKAVSETQPKEAKGGGGASPGPPVIRRRFPQREAVGVANGKGSTPSTSSSLLLKIWGGGVQAPP
eukprot:TRINITY_DN16813_c0_g1_i1.p1 TRINITY_DN16813_c0_g1~~TRINITY_DN16813_c0_g1_i1.p1  ORF type:complete len:421 (-),score=100.46 TRINITY_DN16813_c0_g1_i1:472-1734(-)